MSKNRAWLLVVVFVLFAAACSESDDGGETASTSSSSAPVESTEEGDDSTDEGDDDTSTTSGEEDGADGGDVDLDSVVGNYAGEEWIFGTVPNAPTPADETLEPVKIGMINQVNSPAGAYPEINGAIEAAIEFVNAEMGGVGGRPITLVTCDANIDPTVSQACAQQMVQEEVVALVGGLDIGSTGSIPVLQANGIPQVGGIPANLDEQRAENFFFQSGGTPAGTAAMLKHAKDNGAEKVYLAYGDFDAFATTAEEYGIPAAESLGLEIETASFDLFAPDFLDVLSSAADSGADAVILLAADTACAQAIPLFPEVVPDAQLYMTGACAADEIADALGDDMDLVIMNNEGPSEQTAEGDIYQAVVDKYAVAPAGGTGTVGFRGFMNLYSILDEIGPDDLTSEAITEIAANSLDRPNYWGHPYSCSIEQVPGLPALCAPQQTLFRFIDSEIVDESGGWIDPSPLLVNAGPQG